MLIIPIAITSFDCPTADFDASVAINECYALLFDRKFMWLLDICNFHLVAVYNFELEFIKCFHNIDDHYGHNFIMFNNNNNDSQQQQQQYEKRLQLFAWNRFRKMESLMMSYNNYPNSNYICMELVCMDCLTFESNGMKSFFRFIKMSK